MGIIDSIKERVKGVVQSVTKRAQPKPSNEVRTYVTVKKHGDTTETITSDTPPKVPRESKIRERMERLNEYTKNMVGAAGRTAGKVVQTAEKAPAVIVSKTKSAVSFVRERVPANVVKSVQDVQNQPWQKDIGHAGFQTIKAFTGKNVAPYEKKGKRVKLGRKISKKEAKLLQKRYGSNWKQAIKVDSNRGYYVQSSHREYAEIRRSNKLQSSQVNFGSEFPTPSVFISREESRVPFARRSDDPFDVDANFMGGRGSGFTAQKKDPFAINGGSLMGSGGGNYDLGFNFGAKPKKSQTTRTGFNSGYDIKL